MIVLRISINHHRCQIINLAITCEREISKLEIVRANEPHILEISRLFDLYRQFYKCEPNIDLATQFISDRFNNGESVIFVAPAKDKLKGFVQLYPSFCSVDAVKILTAEVRP